MRWLLILTAVCIVALLLVRVGWPAFYGAGWTPDAGDGGRCWGSVCVLRLYDGAWEGSVGEYQPPPPVVTDGPPIIP